MDTFVSPRFRTNIALLVAYKLDALHNGEGCFSPSLFPNTLFLWSLVHPVGRRPTSPSFLSFLSRLKVIHANPSRIHQ